ncbi:hypothetical protein [Pseudomonas phage GP100]|nr:hypothetical protein [Pseudomonas phage GP100]
MCLTVHQGDSISYLNRTSCSSVSGLIQKRGTLNSNRWALTFELVSLTKRSSPCKCSHSANSGMLAALINARKYLWRLTCPTVLSASSFTIFAC